MRTAALYALVTTAVTALLLPTTVPAVPETTVSFSVADLKFSTEQGYDLVEASGCHLAGEPGHPLLPFKAVNFVIPRDKTVASVKLELGAKHQVPGSYYIFPAQDEWLPWEGAGGFTWPDPGIYGSADPYPGTPVTEGRGMVAWGWNTYQLPVWPLEYIPAKGELWLYETVAISLDLVDGQASQEVLPRSQEQHEEWAEELEQTVANPEDVWPWAPQGAAVMGVPPMWVLILPGPAEQGSTPWYDAFEGLIDWREQQGRTVVVNYSEEISPSHDYQEIRDYLQYKHSQGARWALLAGDHDMIPWYYWPSGMPPTLNVPTDWCYCDLDGGYPQDHDWAPELWVGRVPCLAPSEASNFVEKALVYEQQPGYGSYAYLDSAFYIYMDRCQGHLSCDTVVMHQDDAILDTIFGEDPDWDDPEPTFPWSWQVVAELNRTHYHYVSIHCAGVLPAGGGWEDERADSFACLTHYAYQQPYYLMSAFGPNEFAALQNAGYYQFWYSISCMGGELDFQDPAVRSRAEMAVCSYQRCAVAYAGNTRIGHWTYSRKLQDAAWDLLFPTTILVPKYFNHVGRIEAHSKWETWAAGDTSWSYDYKRYTHNLFGDPATGIWCPKARPGGQKPLAPGNALAPLTISWVSCGPNPVRSDALLSFRLSRPAETRIGVYDVAGRLVQVMHDGRVPAGATTRRWDCSRLSAGVYTIRMVSGGCEATARAVVVR